MHQVRFLILPAPGCLQSLLEAGDVSPGCGARKWLWAANHPGELISWPAQVGISAGELGVGLYSALHRGLSGKIWWPFLLGVKCFMEMLLDWGPSVIPTPKK